LICGIGPRLEALKEAQAQGIVIARHGRLIYEQYFQSFDSATKHDIRSISKSVTSLLVGIALDRGLLADLDAPVFSFFPEYGELRTPEKDRMTLRHLCPASAPMRQIG
jgi:CubicO group peptidase (beta-lactamase class C family)